MRAVTTEPRLAADFMVRLVADSMERPVVGSTEHLVAAATSQRLAVAGSTAVAASVGAAASMAAAVVVDSMAVAVATAVADTDKAENGWRDSPAVFIWGESREGRLKIAQDASPGFSVLRISRSPARDG
jgi:hypothetical protein